MLGLEEKINTFCQTTLKRLENKIKEALKEHEFGGAVLDFEGNIIKIEEVVFKTICL